MTKTNASERQLRGPGRALTLTAQWASAEGAVTMRGLLLSCWGERERLHCSWHRILLQEHVFTVRISISQCFQKGKRSQKVKHRITTSLSNSPPRYRPQRTENRYANNSLYMNYYAHQQTNGSTKWGRPQNAILIGHEKAWSTDTCYKVDEPWKHYASSFKKPDTKKSHTYESIYTEYPRTGKSTETECRFIVTRTWREGDRVTTNEFRVFFCGDTMFSK